MFRPHTESRVWTESGPSLTGRRPSESSLPPIGGLATRTRLAMNIFRVQFHISDEHTDYST